MAPLANKHQHAFTTIATKEVQKYQLSARMHQVELSSTSEARVTEGRQLHIQHFINLHYGTCTRRIYQELGIPCEHTLACILQLAHNVQQYLPEGLSTVTYLAKYL